MRTDLWDLTRTMPDEEFERELAQLRAARALIVGDVAHERAMHRATFGLSTARALEASESPRAKLMRDYVAAGLSDARIRELMVQIPLSGEA